MISSLTLLHAVQRPLQSRKQMLYFLQPNANSHKIRLNSEFSGLNYSISNVPNFRGNIFMAYPF